ncbi:MerC domain-containing protein [Pleionea sp. CnH1-48]|uniref:MerC domain-containing protein n=1 Tax=Pleionea sp. CnH1-48 TaxID=2954494 RepID=UPI00209696A0|nr:MerC domain-containing protein [Pleionea sp. CnH1-48]MCO7224267.1 MerC domain-containing protein [Pleionea sp. CnH1-48]
MKITQAITDKFAIGLSLMCAIHCLALPVLLVLIPSLMALNLDNEAFHIGMVIAVLPTSVFALTLGCKQHKRYSVVIFGGIGLSLLILALVLGEAVIGEAGEKILTALGASFVALGHWFNYRLCQTHQHEDCACPEEAKQSLE